ncbi:hypothetical protein AVEN_222220-1 [Araneus ventricosus]|uniref:Uncharacterized protein n=1 Tax=Araneus ventricosus TaxID=182803 RepID=A0A4Y2VJ29_ARAVE|nr:hypothetical protein AVEN_222220-1 [Araneus ventricosus]
MGPVKDGDCWTEGLGALCAPALIKTALAGLLALHSKRAMTDLVTGTGVRESVLFCTLVRLYFGCDCTLVQLYFGAALLWFDCTLVRLFIGSTVHWFDCSLVRLSAGSDFVHWFDCSLVRLYIGSTAYWFDRATVRLVLLWFDYFGATVHWFDTHWFDWLLVRLQGWSECTLV